MLDKKKKIIKMQNEILKYMLIKGALKVDISYEEKEKNFELTAKSKVYMEESEMENLISKFSRHKEQEYDYYFDLIGETLEDDELELLFALADNVRIYYEQDVLTFVVALKNNCFK